jgi:hypothetical protein
MWIFKRKVKPSQKTINQAYRIYIEWGPDATIPRDQRLREQFPQVDEATRRQWQVEFDGVSRLVWQCAEQGEPTRFTRQAFGKLVRQDYPWMDDESVSLANTLMGYYAWHDGYA